MTIDLTLDQWHRIKASLMILRDIDNENDRPDEAEEATEIIAILEAAGVTF